MSYETIKLRNHERIYNACRTLRNADIALNLDYGENYAIVTTKADKKRAFWKAKKTLFFGVVSSTRHFSPSGEFWEFKIV